MKHSQLKQLIKEEIRSINELYKFNAGPGGYAREQTKLISALVRWVVYSMDNGDSKEEVLATLERIGEKAINKYLTEQ